MNRVCVLSPAQSFQLELNGIIPDCRQHHHLSRRKAEELIAEHAVFRDDLGNFVRHAEVRWIGRGKRYLAFLRSRQWKRMDSAGTTTMQLIPGGGVL